MNLTMAIFLVALAPAAVGAAEIKVKVEPLVPTIRVESKADAEHVLNAISIMDNKKAKVGDRKMSLADMIKGILDLVPPRLKQIVLAAVAIRDAGIQLCLEWPNGRLCVP